MLKKRIIPLQLLYRDRLVKSVNFNHFRDVGDPVASSKVYNSQYADELIILNIDREERNIKALLKWISPIATECFMPLTFGGGISTYEDATLLFNNGADKVVLNSICYKTPEVIDQIAKKFGTQAIIVAIDVFKDPKTQQYHLLSDCGRYQQSVCLFEHLKQCIIYGAGEILLQSVDRDGKMTGFDLTLIHQISSVISVPLIACGGAGNYTHMQEVFEKTDVNAVACGSIFNFTDSNLIRAKAFLQNYDIAFKQV